MKLQWIDKFDGHLQRELHDFYGREWWTEGRSFEEMVSMIGHSDIVIGCRQLTDARLIGFARVLTDYTFKAMIFYVIVHSEFRGHGIGGAILDRIMSNKALDKIRNFELYCPERLVPYYEKQGFVRRTSLLLKYER